QSRRHRTSPRSGQAQPGSVPSRAFSPVPPTQGANQHMAEQQLERSMLDGKDREQLHAIAGAMGIKGVTRLRKADLVDAILEAASGNGAAANGASNGAANGAKKATKATKATKTA